MASEVALRVAVAIAPVTPFDVNLTRGAAV